MDEATRAEADKQFSIYPLRRYNKGQILLFSGENPVNCYYLVNGIIRKYDISYKGNEVIVGLFKPPYLLPVSWIVNKTPNKFYYDAAINIEVRIIPPEIAAKFVKSSSKIMFSFLKNIYSDNQILLGRMVHLMIGNARSRVLYELLAECHKFGKDVSSESCKIFVNESDLASQTGLSRETVSREIHKLSQKGLLTVGRNCILIKDHAKLEKLLEESI